MHHNYTSIHCTDFTVQTSYNYIPALIINDESKCPISHLAIDLAINSITRIPQLCDHVALTVVIKT